jgi:hypothetical protein
MFTRTAIATFCTFAACAAPAHAVIFTATDGSANVDITAVPNGPNTDVTVILRNLTPAASIAAANDTLTGLSFNGIGGFTLLTQAAPQQFTFSTQTTGALDVGAPFDPSWAIVTAPPFDALYFDGFGSGGKPIISPAIGGTTYPNANSSLTSGPHGTYIYGEATFVLSVAGAFDPGTLADVTFRFDTDGLTTVPGVPDTGTGIPEPASLALLGIGGVALLKRRSRA